MIDLSHHNGPVDFRRLAEQGGQRRVYLKRGGFEPHALPDKTFPDLRKEGAAGGIEDRRVLLSSPAVRVTARGV
jgi:hypothetical protein